MGYATTSNLRGSKTGHYVFRDGKWVKVGDKPVAQKSDWNDVHAPFEARIRAGIKRQEEKGGRFSHKVKTLKSTWGL
jgi:hypothetical protein